MLASAGIHVLGKLSSDDVEEEGLHKEVVVRIMFFDHL
jgi:hypothetical protein